MLASLLMLGAATAGAQTPVRQVLLLQSFDRGNLILDHFSGHFRVSVVKSVETPLNIVQITVGQRGFVGASEQAMVDYIRATFANRPTPDLIVTVAAPAALFARKYRQQLFPEAPLLLAAIDQRFVTDAPLADNEAAVSVVNDFPKLVDDVLQVLPQTNQVFMVMGSGPVAQLWRQELENQFKQFQDRVTFVWSGDMSLAEILRRCRSLPEHSVIFYFAFGTDASGVAYADEQILAELHATANAPLFAAHSVYLGTGAVGGTVMPIDVVARNAVDAAVRILNGESAGKLRPPPLKVGKPIFDWRELQRWKIDEVRLPPDSEVRYRRPSLWQEYRVAVLIAVGALAIQALLIVMLLLERRARNRAELDSRRNLALAADASRRETMAALTSSIAHDLSQPLTSMVCNAEALQAMVATDRSTPEKAGEILSDIRAAGALATQIIDRHRKMLCSRQLFAKPVELNAVVRESLALVAHELKSRQIEAIFNPSSSPCIVSGDQVLVQQVLVNLMMNAMDAMIGTPSALRRLTIASEVRGGNIEISLRDTGTGLPADIIGTVFKPFVTTKPHGIGIGLTIVRTIVDAHGGTIRAQNNSDGGATFSFTLPRAETADRESIRYSEPATISRQVG